MARTPYATEVHDTSQKSVRSPSLNQPTYIVIHHAATQSLDAVVAMEMGAKQVSSTVVVKDGRVASMFDESYRAWSLSSQYWDSLSLSSETCNSGGAAEGWPISEESYKTLAKVVADWCRRHSIPCNRDHIIGHREVYTRYGDSYATACPGGIDLDRLVAMAAAILSGLSTAGDSGSSIEEEVADMAEMYVKAPNGAVVHLQPRVKVTFQSEQEYNNWRSIATAHDGIVKGSNVVPPALSDALGVSWGGFVQVCQHFGVDPATDTNGTRSLTDADIAAIAAADKN